MKLDIYQMVTDRIIAQLESGIIPWKKPWTGVSPLNGGAFNRITKKSYSILNQMLLGEGGEYATFKQWSALGGKIRKGEKQKIVVFWKVIHKTIQDKDGNDKEVGIPFLQYYGVFHISQVDGVEPLNKEELKEVDPIPEADEIIDSYVKREGIKYQEIASNEAYYSPLDDRVVVPMKSQFENANEFYSTAFHELTHSTGHKTRLDRSHIGVAAFGSEEYSKEELVAELGAAGMLNILGIEIPETFKNSTAYIQSWIKALRNDKKMIVMASSKAEKAIAYILGR